MLFTLRRIPLDKALEKYKMELAMKKPGKSYWRVCHAVLLFKCFRIGDTQR